MAKQIFEVTRKEITYDYCYIEAESKEQAEEIAMEKEEIMWRSSQSYECDIDRTEVAKPEDLKGIYIETENDTYLYK